MPKNNSTWFTNSFASDLHDIQYQRNNAMNNPMVSIVLPTYNGEQFLAEAIQSCINQTYDNWELIVVDDASTDGAFEVIDYFVKLDNRILVVRNHVNSGLPASLNVGFSHARGKYFTWTSDDNMFRDNALEVLVGELEMCPEIDIVYAGFYYVDRYGARLHAASVKNIVHLGKGNVIGACFLYGNYVHQQLNGFAEDMQTVEDYDFWLRASNRFQFKELNQPLYYYRIHGGSLSATCMQEVQDKTKNLIKKNLSILPCAIKRDALNRIICQDKEIKELASTFITIGNIYFGWRQFLKARKYYALSAGLSLTDRAYYKLGVTSLRLGNKSEASGYFLKTLEVEPGHRAARKWLDEHEKLSAKEIASIY